MKFEITTRIEIHASKETIWEVLTETKRYPQWNPFIQSLEGKLDEGEKLKVTIHPPSEKPMTFAPTVLICRPNQKLQWIGKLGIRGIFDGKHTFEIRPLSTNKCVFIQAERFSGILVPLLKKTLYKTKLGFEHMNEALKNEVEKR